MSPRKEMYRIPHSQIRMFQRDAKKMVNGPYYCPTCGKNQLQILVSAKNKEAYAICVCGVNQQLTYAPVFQGVDYYSKYCDTHKKK